MRPKAPKAGKRILLEYIPFVWNRLSFLHKVSIRNIVRYKKRLFMMLLGVGGCTALIVAGLGLRDSISTVVDDQFRGVTHYQIAVTFVSPMDEAQQQAFREKYADEMTQCIFVHAAAYEARTSSGINKVNVIATDDPAITQAIDLHENGRTVAWPQQGVLLDAALARDTGVSVGETLPVSVDDTTSVDLPVAGTFENYVYHYAYMTAETYRDLFGADCEYSTAYILTDGDAYALGAALASNSRVASVTVSEALQDIVDNTMKSLDYIVGLVVVCACALALVVLFNLCNISITERVREIAAKGTGCVEIKSGYGLTTEDELKMLRVIRRIRETSPITVRATFLGAHAVGRAYKGRQQEYVDLICREMIPAVGREKLAEFVDVFCDQGFFTVEETEQILRAGAEYGLVPKIHANELAVSGGVQVGVRNKALSVDHLERMGTEEIEVLRTSGTMPTMLPGAAFFLEMPYPPARAMIEGGLSVALASDFNPGSSPSGSMKMIVSLACIKMRMTPAEAINAATLNGAYAMGLSSEYGSITVGKKANFFLTTKIPSVAYLPYAYTSPLIHRVFLRGQEVK